MLRTIPKFGIYEQLLSAPSRLGQIQTMANLTGIQRERYVREMFTRIAQHYDLMNRLMTAGQDVYWRQEVIRRARLGSGQQALDLGAGTGDLSFEALRQSPGSRLVAMDFTLAMMQTGRMRSKAGQVLWAAGNAMSLPFPDGTFDAVVSGFLLRNVSDLDGALLEQMRVLTPGGRFVTLDTTRPRSSLLSPFIQFHMHVLIPALGKIISRQPDAYRYLPDTTEGFLSAEELSARMIQAGFKEVGFRLLMFGTAAIHWGIK